MPLLEDQVRALQQRVELPAGSVPGTRLTWVGPTDADVDWVSDPDSQILVGNGDPNGDVYAPMGTLYVERDAPALWQNDDGQSSWTELAPVAPTPMSFPITNDNGTVTRSVTVSSTAITVKADDNSSAYEASVVADANEAGTASTMGLQASTAAHTGFLQMFAHNSHPPRARLISDGNTTDWFVWAGDPNTNVTAAYLGSLCVDPTNTQIWIATNSTSTAWVPLDQKKWLANATATGTVTVNHKLARVHQLTLTGNITTLTLTAPLDDWAAKLTLYLVQGGAGSFTVTWPASVKWPGGAAPTLSTAVGAVDKVELETFDAGTTWYANTVGLAFA